MRRFVLVWGLVGGFALLSAATAAAFNPDALVSNGSPTTPFSQNKQNEPTITADANSPNILVAGSDDENDKETRKARAGNTPPFTPRVGSSGVYFSFYRGGPRAHPPFPGWGPRHTPGAAG